MMNPALLAKFSGVKVAPNFCIYKSLNTRMKSVEIVSKQKHE